MINLRQISLALFMVVVAAFGQTTMTSTTTTALMTNTQATVNLTATTGVTAPANQISNSGIGNPSGTGIVLLFVDQELMRVNSVNTTTKVASVSRGWGGTAAMGHVSGATVWVGPASSYRNFNPSGACVRANLPYVPLIVPSTGAMFDCLGVTTAGQYVRTNAPGIPVVGSTVSSATSITPTGTTFVVSGTTAIATIVVPAGFAPGMSINIIPSGIFATTTAGNISLITSASVVSRVLTFVWDGSKWNPSYVS